MPVLLYQTIEPGRARVTTIIHQPDKVDQAVVATGISVDSVPSPSVNEDYQRPVLYVNPSTKELWHEGEAIPIHPVKFKQLLTREERKAVRREAKKNEDVDDFLDLLNTANEVRLNDDVVVAGINLLVSVRVLTQARADEILALGA